MLCQSCGKHEAVFHFKTNFNGNISEHHLCAECAAKTGMSPYSGSGNGFFGSMLTDLFSTAPRRESSAVCAFCGATERDIRRNGKVGCAHCYDTFAPLLDPYIRQIHGNAAHTGKAPSGAGDAIRLKRQLEALKKELNAAVEAQAYEKAAELRDQIRELEGGRQNEQ